MRMRWRTTTGLGMALLHGLLVLTLLLTGTTQAAAQQPSALETIKKNGVLRIGVSTFVPWAMRDKKGDLVGFEIDVARKLAGDMGVKMEHIPTAWDGIIPGLLAGKFDIIISGLSITPERSQTVDFTVPYSHSGLQMAANKKLAGNFKGIQDFNQANVTLTCRRGTTACREGQKQFPKAVFRQFDDDAQAFQDVVNGNAHAMLASAPRPRFWTLQNKETLFMPTEENLTTTDEAFALRKGDLEAVKFFNAWIQTQTNNGWLKGRHTYWFGTMEWASQVELKQ